MLLSSQREPLRRHLVAVREIHERDLAVGQGRVVLPDALDRRFPNAATSWLCSSFFRRRGSAAIRVTGRRRTITCTSR